MIIFSKNKSGMSLVEVIIASAVVLLISTILISTNLTYFKTSNNNLKSVKAIYLAEEGIEVVNFLAGEDWNNLEDISNEYIDEIYERKFFIESVNRDSNDQIVLIGGNTDNNTRKITVYVSYFDTLGTTTKSISAYIFNPNE